MSFDFSDAILLGIESSRLSVSVAVAARGTLLSSRLLNGEAPNNSRALLPMIDDVLRETRIAKSDLTGICASTGPGSLTSLRISLATALGISKALAIPHFGVNCLQLLANRYAYHRGSICVAQKTYRKMAHIGHFFSEGGIPRQQGEIVETFPHVLIFAENETTIVTGDAARSCCSAIPQRHVIVSEEESYTPLQGDEVLFHFLRLGRSDSFSAAIRPEYGGRPEAELSHEKKHGRRDISAQSMKD